MVGWSVRGLEYINIQESQNLSQMVQIDSKCEKYGTFLAEPKLTEKLS